MGAKTVYKTPDIREGQTAAVTIQLDGSGSMATEAKYQTAMAIHTATAIESAGAPCRVAIFMHSDCLTVKDFGERVSQIKGRFLSSRKVTGGTPDG